MDPASLDPGPPPAQRSRGVIYLLIALASFIAGMAFAHWDRRPPGVHSRVDWPAGPSGP
jgi:hypothetical protein